MRKILAFPLLLLVANMVLVSLACQVPANQIRKSIPTPTGTSIPSVTETASKVPLLENTATHTPSPLLDRVTAFRSLYVRSLAGTDKRILGFLSTGDVVELIGECDSIGWIKIKNGHLTGWVNASFLERGCERE